MFLAAFGMLMYVPAFIEIGKTTGNFTAAALVGALAIVHAVSAWVIGASHAFKRLTSRSFDRH
jgi:hypothetical protein